MMAGLEQKITISGVAEICTIAEQKTITIQVICSKKGVVQRVNVCWKVNQ